MTLSQRNDTTFGHGQQLCNIIQIQQLRNIIQIQHGSNTPLGYRQQLCEILLRSNMAVTSYGSDIDLGYVCTVTLTLEI